MAAVEAAVKYDGPVYLRFGRLPVPQIYDENTYKFEIGKGVQLAEGKDATIIATGLMVPYALEARELLKNDGIDAAVINIHTIKPIDREIIANAAKNTGAIVTAEEHNVNGGLGSAVAEVLCETCPVPMLRVGTQDVFGKSGKPYELLKEYGLSAENIAENVKKAIAMKK